MLDASVTMNVCPRLTGTTDKITRATTEAPADGLRLAERNMMRPAAPWGSDAVVMGLKLPSL